jgi:hypothetical protein
MQRLACVLIFFSVSFLNLTLKSDEQILRMSVG